MPDGDLAAFDFDTGLSSGRLRGFSPAGHPLVEAADGAVIEARSLVPLGPAALGRELAYGRLGGPSGTPLILGLIEPPALVAGADEGGPQVIEARERLELRCGPARLTLFADGRVEIRGTQILSRADGAQRIQGASVHLN